MRREQAVAEQPERPQVERQHDTPFDPEESREQHERDQEQGGPHAPTTSPTDGADRDEEAIEEYGSRVQS
jgi:hypothetical protein